jgi:hypothetical protein
MLKINVNGLALGHASEGTVHHLIHTLSLI